MRDPGGGADQLCRDRAGQGRLHPHRLRGQGGAGPARAGRFGPGHRVQPYRGRRRQRRGHPHRKGAAGGQQRDVPRQPIGHPVGRGPQWHRHRRPFDLFRPGQRPDRQRRARHLYGPLQILTRHCLPLRARAGRALRQDAGTLCRGARQQLRRQPRPFDQLYDRPVQRREGADRGERVRLRPRQGQSLDADHRCAGGGQERLVGPGGREQPSPPGARRRFQAGLRRQLVGRAAGDPGQHPRGRDHADGAAVQSGSGSDDGRRPGTCFTRASRDLRVR